MITSVPPDVKIISSALPPTILATFSLDWLIIALALAPTNKNNSVNNKKKYFFCLKKQIFTVLVYSLAIKKLFFIDLTH